MKLIKIKKILFLLIFFLFNFKFVFAIDLENLSEATEELEKVQEEISQIKSSDSETAKSIDSAVQEINKATDFVKETLANGNIDDAINTLEFIEKSLGDVTNLVQPKITSDMTQIDTEAFGEDKMNEVLSVTRAMNENKVKTVQGNDVVVGCETICVHSDTPNAVEILKALREKISSDKKNPQKTSNGNHTKMPYIVDKK